MQPHKSKEPKKIIAVQNASTFSDGSRSSSYSRQVESRWDLLFTASKGKSICVWYLDNGERIGTYGGHDGAIWDIDVTWDTQTLISAGADSSVKVWDVEHGLCLNDINTQPCPARSVSLSYSGNLAAVTTSRVGQTPASICVMDLREAGSKGSGASYLFRELVETPSEACVFTNLDDVVVFGYSDGSLAQYDLRQPETFLNFSNPHNGRITDLQLSDDRSANKGFIISSSADKTAQLHNARDLMELKKYRSGRPVNSAAISPVRDHIVLGGGEEARSVTQTAASSGQFEAKLYHLVYEEEFARFKGHFGPINSIAFNPTGNVVVTGGEDGLVRIQELDQEYLDFDFDY
uniref:Serine-threonine kinase receptor-associated protein n=1 Tax=Ditylenchus dipsaci TaxID=166011 RepID=A0A915DXK8_9BILA